MRPPYFSIIIGCVRFFEFSYSSSTIPIVSIATFVGVPLRTNSKTKSGLHLSVSPDPGCSTSTENRGFTILISNVGFSRWIRSIMVNVLRFRSLSTGLGALVTVELMREIAARLTVPIEPLLPFVDQPLRNLYQGAICGGVVFELTGGNHRFESRFRWPSSRQWPASCWPGRSVPGEVQHAGWE